MQIQVLDFDGSVAAQDALRTRCRPAVVPFGDWSPRLRMACSHARFRQFERELAVRCPAAEEPALTLYGSGDFHHISLALVRRLRTPFNLLVLDKHPDWMRGIPFLHCGTWLYHAARTSLVQRIFHVGGELDFDNHYRWLAPWPYLEAGRIRVFPAVRRFRRGRWARVGNEPVRAEPATPVTRDRLGELLQPCAADLARWPLYISVDKDVLVERDAAVNWDSGYLELAEAQTILAAFVAAAGGRLAGLDLLGDWSPVRVQGVLRHALHWTEHPPLSIDPAEAARRNERANLALLTAAGHCPSGSQSPPKALRGLGYA
jgi:hypothetical protein